MKIVVKVNVKASLAQTWSAWNEPGAIEEWHVASPDWHTPRASVDLRQGGRFNIHMEARDGSAGFDFKGRYTRIERQRLIEYTLNDERRVRVEFMPVAGGVTVREIFTAENSHGPEQQRQGWQSILDNFARYVESSG